MQLQTNESLDSYCKIENPTFQKDAIASSLREFGGTIKNAFEVSSLEIFISQ